MEFQLLGAFANYALGFSLFFISLFLIFIILIQRGRGGGLSGALGGTGQSAFGSRAGDEMTYITLIVSAIWILLCVVCIWVLNPKDSKQFFDDDAIEQTSTADDPGMNLLSGETPTEDGGEDQPAGDGGEAIDPIEAPGDTGSTGPDSPAGEAPSPDDSTDPEDPPAEPENDDSTDPPG